MGDWNYFALISIFVLLSAIILWFLSAYFKLSKLDFVRKKWISYFSFVLYIIPFVICAICIGVYIAIMISPEEPIHGIQSNEEIGEILKVVAENVESSKTSLKTLDLSTFKPITTPFDRTLVNDIEGKFNIISIIIPAIRRIESSVTKAKKIGELLTKLNVCPIDFGFAEFASDLTKAEEWSKAVEKAWNTLEPVMRTTIDKYANDINGDINKEKESIEKHQTETNIFLANLADSLSTAKQAVKKRVPGNRQEPYSIGMKFIFGTMVILPGVGLLGFFICSCLILRKLTSEKKTCANIFFFISVGAVAVSLVIYWVMYATDPDGCSSNSEKKEWIEFDFSLPRFKDTTKQNTKVAFKNCGLEDTTIFAIPNDKIFIPESPLIKNYREMWNSDIEKFINKINTNKFDVGIFSTEIKKLTNVLKDLETHSCVTNPSDTTDITRHLGEIQKLDEDTILIQTQLTPLIANFSQTCQNEIDKKLTGLKDTLQKQIDIFDESMKKSDFKCKPIHSALTKDLTTKCEKRAFDPFAIWTLVIILWSICCFMAAIFIISIDVSVKKKEKTDEETKQSSATELAKESSNVQLNKVTSTVSAKAELSTNPIELWANLISSANFDNVLTAFDESLLNFKPPNATFKASDANKALNCNKNYQCIDESRVVLKNNKNEYINASWVRVPNSKTPYILTQNPLAETVADFWAMCYAEKVKCIVSFCSPDGGLAKCAPYFPTDVKEAKYMDYEVKVGEPKKDVIRDTIVRKLQVLDKSKHGAQPLFISHVTILWWPVDNKDERMNVPKDAQPAIQLHRYAKKLYPDISPVCVVSGEGVGRSAAFVLLDYAIIRLQQGARMVEIVKEFRGMRNMALENKTQYEVLHVLLLEYFADEGAVDNVVCEKFKKNYTDKHFPPPKPKQ